MPAGYWATKYMFVICCFLSARKPCLRGTATVYQTKMTFGDSGASWRRNLPRKIRHAELLNPKYSSRRQSQCKPAVLEQWKAERWGGSGRERRRERRGERWRDAGREETDRQTCKGRALAQLGATSPAGTPPLWWGGSTYPSATNTWESAASQGRTRASSYAACEGWADTEQHSSPHATPIPKTKIRI